MRGKIELDEWSGITYRCSEMNLYGKQKRPGIRRVGISMGWPVEGPANFE
jgi:hypothetical protein